MNRMRRCCFCLLLALCLGCLGGCQAALPKAADGQSWSEDWVTLGSVVGVETPEGLILRENSDLLAAKGMYFASWSAGDAEPYLNEEGEETSLYDAQLSFLLAGYNSIEEAGAAAAEWLQMAYEQYAVDAEAAETCNGQEFTVITYTCASKTNPYASGASAFGVYGNYAVSAELSCREGFDGNALEILEDFLEHCHYAA